MNPFTREKMNEQDEYYREQSKILDSIMIENFSFIYPYVNTGAGIDVIMNSINGNNQSVPEISAVIVGAGPSLDSHIELLKSYNNDILIICLDAAVPSLYNNGILPHIIVATDPSTRQIKNFKGIDIREPLTCLSSYVHPLTFDEVRRSYGRVLWYHLFDPSSKVNFAIRKIGGIMKGSIYPAVLTSGSAFQIAIWIGVRNLTFIGHDLSYISEEHSGYADGVSEEKIEHQKNSKFVDLIEASDINCNSVLTHYTFLAFKNWLNVENDRWPWPGVSIHNSTGRGILHSLILEEDEIIDTKRIKQIEFEDFLNKYSIPGCGKVAMDLMNEEYLLFRNTNWNIIAPVLKNDHIKEGDIITSKEIRDGQKQNRR